MVKEMRSELAAQITRDLDHGYEAIVDFVHEVQETSGDERVSELHRETLVELRDYLKEEHEAS